jgi:hypothetical protein
MDKPVNPWEPSMVAKYTHILVKPVKTKETSSGVTCENSILDPGPSPSGNDFFPLCNFGDGDTLEDEDDRDTLEHEYDGDLGEGEHSQEGDKGHGVSPIRVPLTRPGMPPGTDFLDLQDKILREQAMATPYRNAVVVVISLRPEGLTASDCYRQLYAAYKAVNVEPYTSRRFQRFMYLKKNNFDMVDPDTGRVSTRSINVTQKFSEFTSTITSRGTR